MKAIRIILLLALVGLLITQTSLIKSFFQPGLVYAVGDVTVDWGIGMGNVGPIFSVVNMAPGQSESRTVTLHNASTVIRPIAIKGLKTNVFPLASAMSIVIKDGGTTIYSQPLTTFFAQSAAPEGIHLLSLAPGMIKSLTIIVLFQPSAGNEYQDQELVFNLIFGIAIAIPAECANVDLTGKFPIYGTAGNNVIQGTPGNDVIFSLEGNDTITGKGGDDCIVGGAGNDVISASEGNDVLLGGIGNDTISAGAGNDKILGGDGKDTITGASGDDSMFGGIDNDTLVGGTGNDNANGEAGKDTCVAETETACEV